MKKFKFTLQTILDLNISIEKQQKNELAAINHRIRMLEEDKVRTENEIARAEDIYKVHIKKQCRVGIIRSDSMYIKSLNEEKKQIETEIEKKNRQKEKLQAMLMKTMAKRKSLEKLSEKQYQKYLMSIKTEQEKETDDFAAFNYIFNTAD